MTQEEKELLLKDLCARLPYGVICYNSSTESNFELCDIADVDSGYPTFDYGYGDLETIEPYLRPMLSMTDEEINILCSFTYGIEQVHLETGIEYCTNTLDWLNAHHFDYRGLIEKNLALDCTGLHIYD